MKPAGRFDEFRYVRRFRAANRAVQIVLCITLAFGLNVIAAKYFKRFDLTRSGAFTLAPETLAYLRLLEQPVDIIITIARDPENAEAAKIHDDLSRLVREYAYASRQGDRPLVRVEHVDLYKQRSRAQEITSRFSFAEENQILVACGDRARAIKLADLYEVSGGEIRGFQGERAFTSAILDVTTERRDSIHFLVGHGEMQLGDTDPLRGLSQLVQQLDQRSFDLANLELAVLERVPEEADLVVVASPQAALMPEEVEKLRRYMDNNGRLIVLLDVGRKHGLGELFADWGIMVDDMAVFDAGPDFRASGGDYLVRRFAQHPITQILLDYQLTALFGQSRPVRADPLAENDERLKVEPIIGSSENSWAERDFRSEPSPALNEERDIRGPIGIAAASERLSTTQLGLNLPGGRLVVFGNSDFIANNRLQVFGNQTLLLNAINWALNRSSMLNIPSRPMASYQVILSEGNLRQLMLYFSFIPGAILLLGLLVTFVRRR